MNHTPAPWTTRGKIVNVTGILPANAISPTNSHPVVYVTAESEAVAQCWLTGYDRGLPIKEREAETIANARLIAAAPDLLAALQMLRDYCYSNVAYFGDPINGDREANELDRFVDAALAKAAQGFPTHLDKPRTRT